MKIVFYNLFITFSICLNIEQKAGFLGLMTKTLLKPRNEQWIHDQTVYGDVDRINLNFFLINTISNNVVFNHNHQIFLHGLWPTGNQEKSFCYLSRTNISFIALNVDSTRYNNYLENVPKEIIMAYFDFRRQQINLNNNLANVNGFTDEMFTRVASVLKDHGDGQNTVRFSAETLAKETIKHFSCFNYRNPEITNRIDNLINQSFLNFMNRDVNLPPLLIQYFRRIQEFEPENTPELELTTYLNLRNLGNNDYGLNDIIRSFIKSAFYYTFVTNFIIQRIYSSIIRRFNFLQINNEGDFQNILPEQTFLNQMRINIQNLFGNQNNQNGQIDLEDADGEFNDIYSLSNPNNVNIFVNNQNYPTQQREITLSFLNFQFEDEFELGINQAMGNVVKRIII